MEKKRGTRRRREREPGGEESTGKAQGCWDWSCVTPVAVQTLLFVTHSETYILNHNPVDMGAIGGTV